MSIEHKIVLVQVATVLVRVKTVLVRVEIVLVQVKMAEVLTDEYFNGENHIQSVILDGKLSVVIKEKLCIHPWISIF